MTARTVEIASAADEAAVASVLTLAFGADPASRWSWPDPRRYLESFPRFIEAFGGAAFTHGSAHRIGNVGAALWLPPDVHPDPEAMDALMRSTIPEDLLEETDAVIEQMERHHPPDPHWYLPLIGVDPSHQGKGYGSALLRHGLAACDRDGLPAYLDSTNPKNIPLYERHGFEQLGTIQIGSSPPSGPMLRRPRKR
jgi:ribosomal protein S18 acetylase RimI-like enzyme